MATIVAQALAARPYLTLLERQGPGDPGTPLAIAPKLARTPKKVKAAKTNTKLAVATDLRIADLPAIGNPTENVPTAGIRVIHWNDRWILFGNTGTNAPRLYEKSGPVYTQTQAYAPGDWPTNASFVHGAFSRAGRFMYAVRSNALQQVQVYQWSGTDENDINGTWVLQSPLAIGANVTGLEISPLNNYLIVKFDGGFRLFNIQSLNAAITPVPAGDFLAVKADELEWVIGATGDLTFVYSHNLTTRAFVAVQMLANSAGTFRRAAYSPDGLVLALNLRPTSGTAAPRFYAKRAGMWYPISNGTRTVPGGYEASKFAFKADSSQLFFTATENGIQRAEFWKRELITPPPFSDAPNPYGTPTFNTQQGRTVRNRAGTKVAFPTTTWSYDQGMNTFTATTPSGWATAVSWDMSGDGNWLLKTTTAAMTLFTWASGAWAAATAPPSPGGTLRGVSLSSDGQFAVLSYNQMISNTGLARVFQRNVGTGAWAQVGADIALNTTDAETLLKICPVFHPIRNDILVVPGMGNLRVPRFFRLISGTWTETTTPFPFNAAYTAQYSGKPYWSSNGQFLYLTSRGTTSTSAAISVFEFNSAANTFSLKQTIPVTTSAAFENFQLDQSVDELVMVMGTQVTGTNQAAWFFKNDGTATNPNWSVLAPPSTLVTGVVHGVVFTAMHLATLNTAGVKNFWEYNGVVTLPGYTLDYAFTGPSSGGNVPPNDGYNRTNTIANFGGSGWAQHPYVNVPLNPTPQYPPQLGFAPQHAITAIWGYQLSETGKTVLYQTSAGIGLASRPNTASTFLNSETLNGCFVSLYDRQGQTFVERNYSVHPFNSIIKDITFSPNEGVLAYHVITPVGTPADTPQGRLIYDITATRFDFRGQVWEAGMTNSLMAFSPFNTEFVVTHENPTAPFISLHEFTVDYAFANQDTKPVPFGPPDFSLCNDVVVAHGGSPPFTFFTHDDPNNLLVPKVVDIDWTTTSPILGVAFSDDCEDIVVITPDIIVVLEPGSETPPVETPLEEPLVPPTTPDMEYPDVDWDSDTITVDPGWTKPNYPGQYDYDPNDPDEPIKSIAYVPYSSVSVTFRVASVPS